MSKIKDLRKFFVLLPVLPTNFVDSRKETRVALPDSRHRSGEHWKKRGSSLEGRSKGNSHPDGSLVCAYLKG